MKPGEVDLSGMLDRVQPFGLADEPFEPNANAVQLARDPLARDAVHTEHLQAFEETSG